LGYGIPDEEAIALCTIQAVIIPSLNVAIVEKDEEFQKSYKEFCPKDKFTLEDLPSRSFHEDLPEWKEMMMKTEETLLSWSKEAFESFDTEKRVIEMRGLQKPKHACVSL
jgi:hypothetical protein